VAESPEVMQGKVLSDKAFGQVHPELLFTWIEGQDEIFMEGDHGF
jgi:hypothetical protein